MQVSTHDTAQRCSSCGEMPFDKITPDERIYRCTHGGKEIDSDVNAAGSIRMNVLDLFRRAPGPACRKDGAPAPQAAPLAPDLGPEAKRGCGIGSLR